MRTASSRIIVMGACIAGAMGYPASSRAAAIVGELNSSGAVSFTGIAPTTTDFNPVGGGTGTFAVGAFSTASFAPLVGTNGTVKDLSSAAEPVGMPVSLADFLTFASDPTIHFTLTLVNSGVFSSSQCFLAPAAGQTCTPSGSAFSLTNTSATSSTLAFTVHGTVTNSGTAETSQFAGTLTIPLAGQSYQSILAVLGGGGTVTASYGASYAVTCASDVSPPVVTAPTGAVIPQTLCM